MDTPIQHVSEEHSLVAAGVAEDGIGACRAGIVWADPQTDVRVGVWKADPGRYGTPGRPYSETFLVVEGNATIFINDELPREIEAGSIVHVPKDAKLALAIRTPFTKFSASGTN